MMSKQLTFKKTQGWGGHRRGAGRKNLSGTPNHMKRPKVTLKQPLHVTLRLKEKLPSLRNKSLFKEFKKSIACAKPMGLYVLHFSVQSNHIHLICEAKSNRTLALGMRSLAGRFAKIVRLHSQRRIQGTHGVHSTHRGQRLHHSTHARSKHSMSEGSVFKGRYHLHVLRTPSETKRALEYVLLNLSRHQKRLEYIDAYSSAPTFQQWKKLLGQRFRFTLRSDADFYERYGPPKELLEVLSTPRSWLAKSGWMRAS